jgi:hypothetical protein
VFHNTPKYIEIKRYILRDEVQKREVVLQYISTDEQITNVLVKPPSKMKNLQARARGDNFLIEKKRKILLPGWEGALMCY